MIGRIWAIALNTIRELVRDRVLAVAVFFGVVITIFAGIVAAKTPLNWGDIVMNVSLGGMNLSLVFITIIMAVNLLAKEIEKKTVFTILTKPVTRAEFIAGKFTGMMVTLFMALSLMTAVVYWLCWQAHWEVKPLFFEAVLSIYGELIIVAAVAMFFSSFSTPYVSGLLSLAVWVSGTLAGVLRKMTDVPDMDPETVSTIRTIYYFLPDFSRLNLKDRVPYDLPPPQGYYVQAPLFVLTWSLGLLCIAVFLFDRRDLK